MFCRVCGKGVESNLDLQSHLQSDHLMSLSDYYRHFPDATKVCNKCKRELPITEFYIDRCKASGYRTQCIHCISPDGEKRECPLCHRLFKWSSVVNHLKNEHEILPIDAYRKYLEKRCCPRCKTIKSLKEFSRPKNGGFSTYCKKCGSDRNRKNYRKRKIGKSLSDIQQVILSGI
jgi:hypothetical protein